MKKIFITTFVLLLTCCQKEKHIKSEKGGIDILTNIYYNASKGLDDHQQIILSKINYNGNNILELVPNIQIPDLIDSVYYVRDSVFYNAGNLMDAKSLVIKEKVMENQKNISDKKFGAIWIKTPISDYDKRKDLNDTILYGKKKFKRFQIINKDNYSIFYIAKTDTILPYSLNSIADKDYSGRLERIDNYDKKRDLFTTIILLPRKNWDQDAAEIFQYNNDIDKIYKDSKNIK